jgi:hypothetical protein
MLLGTLRCYQPQARNPLSYTDRPRNLHGEQRTMGLLGFMPNFDMLKF